MRPPAFRSPASLSPTAARPEEKHRARTKKPPTLPQPPTAAIVKTPFKASKRHLSHPKRRHFSLQKATFCNAVHNLLATNTLQRTPQSYFHASDLSL